ncbi:ragulator complex protein LAMTOR1 [Pseudoliparis swirei]|uniref:ragulator complex protein LAMTOR1 n=1 Tax=Pseudoliparis swirei TaxID=2059687 RepID=UPI0024BD628D|nr:ragulator complex protein LAMTOR1 [Pseudoliparis swirei]
MGCCFSSENETAEQDPDERKPLIPHPNPVSKPPNGADWITTSVPSARTDEQALLTSILTKTAQNIIDVSAADSVMMEQHEYMDKARQYSTKLAALSGALPHKKALASLTSQPHQVLASDPVPYSDVQQVSKIAAYAYSAISQIKVDAKEELVVQFAIP